MFGVLRLAYTPALYQTKSVSFERNSMLVYTVESDEDDDHVDDARGDDDDVGGHHT